MGGCNDSSFIQEGSFLKAAARRWMGRKYRRDYRKDMSMEQVSNLDRQVMALYVNFLANQQYMQQEGKIDERDEDKWEEEAKQNLTNIKLRFSSFQSEHNGAATAI